MTGFYFGGGNYPFKTLYPSTVTDNTLKRKHRVDSVSGYICVLILRFVLLSFELYVLKYAISNMFWTLMNHLNSVLMYLRHTHRFALQIFALYRTSHSYLFIGHVSWTSCYKRPWLSVMLFFCSSVTLKWVSSVCFPLHLFNLIILFKPVCVNWPKSTLHWLVVSVYLY